MAKMFTFHGRHLRNNKRAYRWSDEYHIHIWELSLQLSSAAVIALKHVGDCKISIAYNCKYHNQQSLTNPTSWSISIPLQYHRELGQWRLKSRWTGSGPANESQLHNYMRSEWLTRTTFLEGHKKYFLTFHLLSVNRHLARPRFPSEMTFGGKWDGEWSTEEIFCRWSFLSSSSSLIIINKVCNRGFYQRDFMQITWSRIRTLIPHGNDLCAMFIKWCFNWDVCKCV